MIKKIIVLVLFLFISNCSLNKVENRHGVPFLDKKTKALVINKTNKNDILQLLGPPSTKSVFNNDLWIYIEKKTTRSSILTLGKKKDLKNNILVLEISTAGLLVDKKFYDLNNVQEIKFAKNSTLKSDKDSFVYGFMSSLRQKIDSPKRRRSSKKR